MAQVAFGLNVQEVNPGTYAKLWYYVASALPTTLLTIWVMGALLLPTMAYDVNASAAQARMQNGGYNWFSRLFWPVILIQTSLTDKAKNRRIRGLKYE